MKMEMHSRASLQAIHGIDGGARDPFSLHAWLRKAMKRMEDAERRRRDYEKLMAMGEHELKDIGLTRADVIDAFKYRRGPGR